MEDRCYGCTPPKTELRGNKKQLSHNVFFGWENTSLLCSAEPLKVSGSLPAPHRCITCFIFFDPPMTPRSNTWSQVRSEYAVVIRVMFALLIAYQRSQLSGDHLLSQVSDPFTPTGILFPGIGRPCSVPETLHLHSFH